MNSDPLIPIGTKIKVYRSKIESLLPEKLLDDLPKVIEGEIIDYKMTDGMGIGYILITGENVKFWVFTNELDKTTKEEYKIKDISNLEQTINKEIILEKLKINYKINGNRNFKTILNPINLITWLLYTLKDIY